MRLRKALFVLPNLFTVSSIFCGFYALSLCAGEQPGRYYQAALAILFAIFFDAFDGRVARLTKTQSEFGMQLDSLADVVSFGAAPALLLYKWALAPLGFWGLLVAAVFVACGALRLARFNLLANRHASDQFFVGLPIPVAAGGVIALVMARGISEAAAPAAPVAVLSLGLSYLMVSNIRFRTFKRTKLNRRRTALLFLVAGLAVVLAVQFQPAVVLVAFISAYVLLGLAEGMLLMGRTRLERRRSRLAVTSSGATEPADDADDDDDDDDADFV
ncbi:MAG TPA: CDP-diacylglycerol--serine O-phosphatidyltransferase [Myxococcales bacterium]|nr:CDP-diacylglycerol--serine O-phosphatidyltransferase [Myxococcales bacterium]